MVKSLQVRWRAFVIWQKLGYLPWRKAKGTRSRKGGGDFYKGAFDSIPFLNDDAKRTFSHLLLRPGYMMRDYLRGDHERYLAPLTALIIFYAFFALISAVLEPVQHQSRAKAALENMRIDHLEDSVVRADLDLELEDLHLKTNSLDSVKTESRLVQVIRTAAELVRTGYIYLHLDQFPEEVDTQHESSIAALESTLRSQGIPLFLGHFILLWLAMCIALRRFKLGMSAYAAVAAYTLCQFSFFMLFAVLLTWGESTSVSALLLLVLLTVDLHQLLGLPFKKSLRRAIAVGIHYGLLFVLTFLLISLLALLVAYLKG